MKAKGLNLVNLAKYAADEDAAIAFIESIVWPDGEPTCPHCENKGAYKLTAKPESKKGVRKGAWKCKKCRKTFTVRIGTIFEDSHMPLGKWLLAIHLLCSSKKCLSAHQLHRQLGISYKAAWFMAHRIRYAMTQSTFTKLQGDVEVDETYVGGKPKKGDGKVHKRGRGTAKVPVVALVERKGNVRTKVIANVTAETLKGAVREYVDKGARILTDEHCSYTGLGNEFLGGHESVVHSRGEYARDDINTNTVESFFALLKRSVYGSWHRVSKKHLHRYATEVEFRWNHRQRTDAERTVDLIALSKGKRMSYVDVKHDGQTDQKAQAKAQRREGSEPAW